VLFFQSSSAFHFVAFLFSGFRFGVDWEAVWEGGGEGEERMNGSGNLAVSLRECEKGGEFVGGAHKRESGSGRGKEDRREGWKREDSRKRDREGKRRRVDRRGRGASLSSFSTLWIGSD